MATGIKKHSKIVKEFQHRDFNISLNENNILTVEATSEMEYEGQHVDLIIDTLREFTSDTKYLVLIVAGDHSAIGYEGLKSLAKAEAFKYAYAKAYVISTLSQRLMANFYMNFFRPEVPVKTFGKKQDAEAWLLKKFRHLYSATSSNDPSPAN